MQQCMRGFCALPAALPAHASTLGPKHDASSCGASLPHCHAPSVFIYPALSILGGLVSPVLLGVFGGVRSAQWGIAGTAPVPIGMGAHTQSTGSGPHDARGLHIATPVPSARKINAPRCCMPASCCPAHGPSASVLSLLAGGAAAGQRDVALFPLTVGLVDVFPGPRIGLHAGPFKMLRICSVTMLV